MDYVEINKALWNKRSKVHFDSEFYDNKSFIKGRNSLMSIELDLLGDLQGKSVLHLQCHFGQDTISMSRMGAQTTGVDFSDDAIDKARELNETTKESAEFICCDIYDLPKHLDKTFDVVFTSYGTIGWLPDINRWASIVSKYLKPDGQFVFAEFHPVVWMFDDDFQKVSFRYFKSDAIIDVEEGTYGDRDADINSKYVSWNHGIGEVVTSLINNGLTINALHEFDYSPYNCFSHTVKLADNKYRIKHMEDHIPMVYSLMASKALID